MSGKPLKVRADHPIWRMTPEARVVWFGKSEQCREEEHERCSTFTSFRHKGWRYPCGCACHWK